MKKLSNVLRVVFGYGIMACLFVGGLIFLGYVGAMIIGGPIATEICFYIYKKIIPIIIYTSNILVILGLVVMYLNGEKALTADKKKASKHKGEL